ncbi:hypothetical protein [Salarchaeum japonicum]|uniref:hypothetical protein n=1 Tax=Salarchaeum japonicum TaxID=555573 RepID=UPI003C72BDD5
MRPPSTLSAVLVVAGVVLFAFPLVAPPQGPPDTVEYYVEDDFGDQSANPNLAYANFSENERRVFDAALANRNNTYVTDPENAPGRITPDREAITLYNVKYQNDYDALQVRRLSDPPSDTAVLGRFGSLLAGCIVACYGGYRALAN